VADGSGNNIATYIYSSSSLSSVRYADGSKYVYSYASDPNGNPIIKSVKDAIGTVLQSYTYDSSGRVKTAAGQNGGGSISFTYVNQSETDVTDALGNVTKFSFQSMSGTNKILHVDNGPAAKMSLWNYDASGNITGEVNSLGENYTYAYDANGNLGTATDPLGFASTFTYDAYGNMTSFTDPTGTPVAITWQGPSADEPGICPASGMGVDLNSCLNACAAGGEVLRQFCERIPEPKTRATCWGLEFVGEVACRGWCYWHF